MIRYFLIRKMDGNVVSYSDGPIVFDDTLFCLKKIKTTKAQDDKIEKNYTIKYLDKDIKKCAKCKPDKIKDEPVSSNKLYLENNHINKLK